METVHAIQQLINGASKKGMIDSLDHIYVRNRILSLLGLHDWPETEEGGSPDSDMFHALDFLVDDAARRGVIDDTLDDREILSSQIMNVFLPKPSAVNKRFYQLYEQSPRRATDYFYQLSRDSNYIQTRRIARNITYQTETEYGELDITINLSKPEKDPRNIAKSAAMKSIRYPKCVLCMENEGYAGRAGHPARSNHRIVRLKLGGEPWGLQYSPYLYYNEHCIVLSAEHRKMKVNRETFSRLLEFIHLFPDYFIGSNADLPIVGGSILSHDHYQGGRYTFAMAKAEIETSIKLEKFPSVEAGIVKWPLSVIRLRDENRSALIDAATDILDTWRHYSDPAADILAYTGSDLHNTITPIARRRGGRYELDLVLRNNRTSEEHPLGIFHPHADIHHIKKENIGLIEVMGLAVLPARLKDELHEVEQALIGRPAEVKAYHRPWLSRLREAYPNAKEKDVQAIVRKEVGRKFLRALEDAGVYKRTEAGRTAFLRFIEAVNRKTAVNR
ncbi:UDP-glucose--hexose-1-phosphate uridylyltransferase [Sporolactobacillus sp. THM7-7]|nr:UDP-glucose--hexose-1-phosphate uridylyltransferase [Sporolactobacillus sp. THM7-7]